jgi:hypothetical protein
MTTSKQRFIYPFLGTVAGGLVLAGLLALGRYLAHLDLLTIFAFVVLPAVAIIGCIAILTAGRGVGTWANEVEERLAALEARDNPPAPANEPVDEGGTADVSAPD